MLFSILTNKDLRVDRTSSRVVLNCLGVTFLGLDEYFMHTAMSGNMEKMLSLIQMNGIILDMLKESGKWRLSVSWAEGKASEFLRVFNLRNRHGKDEFRSNSPYKPNPFM
jgi:hypothetical protein